MKHIKLTEKIYLELEEAYDLLDECEINDEVHNVQNQLAGVLIDIGQRFELLEHELEFGNVQVKCDSILRHFDTEGILRVFRLVKRTAKEGDIVRIVSGGAVFTDEYVGRFFRVTKGLQSDGWVSDHVVVGYWALYEGQYIVLEEIVNE